MQIVLYQSVGASFGISRLNEDVKTLQCGKGGGGERLVSHGLALKAADRESRSLLLESKSMPGPSLDSHKRKEKKREEKRRKKYN